MKVATWVKPTLMLVGIGLMAWMISKFPIGDIWGACAGLGFWVLLTPLIAVGWYAAASRGVYELLERKMPWRALLWNRVIGEGYNMLLPAAGFGGEPFKLQQIRRYVDTERAVVALLNDRLIENTIGLGYSAVCLALGAMWLDVSPAIGTSMLAYAGVAGGVSLVMATIVFARVPGRIGARIAKWLGASDLSQHQICRASLARALVWTALARAIGFLETILLFHLLGLAITPWTVIFTTGAIAAAGFVGGVIPQGLGVTEAVTVGIFELLHFPGPAAIAFALARRGRMLVVSVLGVTAHMVFHRRIARVECDDQQAEPAMVPDADAV